MPKWAVATGAGVLLAVLVIAAIWATRAESEPTASAEAAATSASPSGPSTPPTPTPDPTPQIELWAGDVCVAADGLTQAVVQVASSLEYDPQDPASIGEQFERQLPGQLDGVEAAASDLGAALGTVPLDYVEAAAAVSVLQERIAVLTAAKDQALGHVEAARNAGDPISAGSEWLQAAASAKDTYDAGVAVKDSLGGLADSTDGDVRQAFARAPECAGAAWLIP